jgi:hypothetical protein
MGAGALSLDAFLEHRQTQVRLDSKQHSPA